LTLFLVPHQFVERNLAERPLIPHAPIDCGAGDIRGKGI
jgi:hypothetical protein